CIAAYLREREIPTIDRLSLIGTDVVRSSFVDKVREPLRDALLALIKNLEAELGKVEVEDEKRNADYGASAGSRSPAAVAISTTIENAHKYIATIDRDD